mgnify:FL=1
MTVKINLHNVTEFGKVSDIWSSVFQDRKGLSEFVKNVVMNMDMCDGDNTNGYGIMLSDLSNIMVLVSNSNFPFDKLDESQKRRIDIDSMESKKYIVLGYIWIHPYRCTNENTDSIPCHLIQYIDSRISGLNIAKYMIDQYENSSVNGGISLLPYEIGFGADKYWKKYFEEEYHIKTVKKLNKLINDCNLNQVGIKWQNLFELL